MQDLSESLNPIKDEEQEDILTRFDRETYGDKMDPDDNDFQPGFQLAKGWNLDEPSKDADPNMWTINRDEFVTQKLKEFIKEHKVPEQYQARLLTYVQQSAQGYIMMQNHKKGGYIPDRKTLLKEQQHTI